MNRFFKALAGAMAVWVLPVVAFAQGFQPLVENVPQIQNVQDLPSLLNGLFVLTIGAGAVLAVIMVAIGGFQYMGSDSFSSKGAAKERMLSAVIGLGIILMSVLILGTINPNILNLNPFQGVQPVSSSQYQVNAAQQQASQQQAADDQQDGFFDSIGNGINDAIGSIGDFFFGGAPVPPNAPLPPTNTGGDQP